MRTVIDDMVRLAARLDEAGEHSSADKIDGMIRSAWMAGLSRYLDDAARGVARWTKGGRLFHTIDPQLNKMVDKKIAAELQGLPLGMLERGNAQEIYQYLRREAIPALAERKPIVNMYGGTSGIRRTPPGGRDKWAYQDTWNWMMQKGQPPVEKIEQSLSSNLIRNPGYWGQTPGYASLYGIPALGAGIGWSAGSAAGSAVGGVGQRQKDFGFAGQRQKNPNSRVDNRLNGVYDIKHMNDVKSVLSE